ncbi:unnamed protein product [Ilex paraguariensis]|uniref:Cytochrome P450 n=1 Tax=Ilex paraguariensis TaxID=185542 RepID=A0ABC8T233_9AQUA
MAIIPVTLSWLPLLALLSLPFLSLCLLYLKKKTIKQAKLPPGPPRLPIIGNLHQLGKLHHQSLFQLSRKYGPVMLLKLGTTPTIVISSANMAKEVLKTHDIDFCSRPSSPGTKRLAYNFLDVAFTPYSDQWQHTNRLFVSELFNSNRAKLFWRAREIEIDNLISSLLLASPSPVNLDQKFYALVDGVLCSAAFGKSYRGKQFKGQNLEDVLAETLKMLSSLSAEDFFPWIGWIIDIITGYQTRLDKCFNNLDDYFQMVLEEHLHQDMPKSDCEDLVTSLVRLSKDKTGAFCLTNNHIKAILLDTFIGGTDTSAITMVWAMSEIVKNPRLGLKIR